MNPDTKLTVEQLKVICARHNIPYISHSRINSGFSHEVHRLNDDMVIKLFNTEQPRRFKTELAMLASDLPFLKPKLIASHKAINNSDRGYIIMSHVLGASLGSKWHLANDNQRERLVKDISNILKTINQMDLNKLISDEPEPWNEWVQTAGNKIAARLLAKKIIDEPMAKRISDKLADNSKLLVGSKLYPVYWDIHFDNFIVNDNFELQAIIDLENVEITSLDYPLFVVQKLTDQPHKYLREEDEKYAHVKDYAHLKDWYKEYYPEMFTFDNLDSRIKTYQLLDSLHLLIDWWGHEGTRQELAAALA